MVMGSVGECSQVREGVGAGESKGTLLFTDSGDLSVGGIRKNCQCYS